MLSLKLSLRKALEPRLLKACSFPHSFPTLLIICEFFRGVLSSYMHPRIVSQRSPPAVYRHFCNFVLFRCLLQRSYPNNNFFSIIIWWILDRFSSRVKSIFQSRRIKKPDVTTIGYSGEKNQRGKEALKGSGEGWESLRERLHESIVLKNSRYERAMFSARSLVPRESAHNAIEERTTSDKNMSSCLHSSREVLELFAGITNPNKLDSNLSRRQKKKF